jgi:hypothetical protein
MCSANLPAFHFVSSLGSSKKLGDLRVMVARVRLGLHGEFCTIWLTGRLLVGLTFWFCVGRLAIHSASREVL